MKIAVILGSGRDGRKGEAVVNWILEKAQARGGAVTYELVDIKDYELPFYTNELPPSFLEKQYGDAAIQCCSDTIDQYAGFVFVTPEYNHSVPAQFKNAFDHLYSEWKEKPVLVAGYSWGGGKFCIPAWREVVGAPQMRWVERPMSFFIGEEWVEGQFVPAAAQEEKLHAALSEVETLLGA
ncbi:MAG: NAD(P)H-dependent oxidoreductase [Actinomycetaceae bacterium]|nr:NAD(P)H-dependent oxidoreductase [Actinomycetaceae bacterium]